jgi:hypothetical protein
MRLRYLAASNKRSLSNAQDEDQERGRKAVQDPLERWDQAVPGVQAPHPYHKTTKVKRQLRGMTEVHAADEKLIRAMLPYA